MGIMSLTTVVFLQVAATRAKYFLLLASADQAMLNGQRSYTEPSRFLTEAVKKQMSTQAVDAQEFAETRELFAALVKTGASNAATVELMKTAQRLLASKKSHVSQRYPFSLIILSPCPARSHLGDRRSLGR